LESFLFSENRLNAVSIEVYKQRLFIQPFLLLKNHKIRANEFQFPKKHATFVTKLKIIVSPTKKQKL